MIRSALFAALLSLPLAAMAQNAPSPDEFLALNIYLQRGEDDAVQAELRRLQLKYPGWTPPADLTQLSGASPSTEIDRFYQQLAAGNLDQARQTLAETKSAYPNWTPPAEMTRLLDTAAGQKALDDAFQQGNQDEARAIAARTPGLLRCDRINNAWRIAEGQAKSGNSADALATYRGILAACLNTGELVATIEKADPVSSETELRSMVAQVSGRFPDEAARYDALLQRLLAGRGVATAQQAITPKAKAKADAPAATPPAAARQPAPATALVPARPAAPAQAAPAPRGRAESPAQCVARTSGSRAPGTVLERAWCVYNLDRTMEAMADFRSALSGRLNAQQRQDALYGLSLSYLKLGMSEEASQVAAQTDFTRKQRVDIERQILDQRGVKAYQRKRYKDAIGYFDALEQLTGRLRRELDVLRAYAYLNSGNRQKARVEFMRLNSELSTNETRRGLSAASGE